MASTYFRPIVLITAIISLAQAIAWFVMSLLGILAYRCDLVPSNSTDNASKFMVFLYFQGPNCEIEQPSLDWRILSSQVFATPLYLHGWMCTYLTFNVTYFIIATGMLFQLCRHGPEDRYPLSIIRLWTLNTAAFLIMDLWLTIVFGVDYGSLQNYVSSLPDASLGWTSSVPGALMAITARGFVLYALNFALFCYLVRASFSWRQIFTTGCCQPSSSESRQQLNKGYSSDSIPRVHPSWDNGQVLVPVSAVRRPTVTHPGEGVTNFNEWYGPAQPQPYYNDHARPEPRSVGRPRPPSPPRRAHHDDDEVFQTRPNVRSVFEYPDRRNFEQEGARNKPTAQRNDNTFY